MWCPVAFADKGRRAYLDEAVEHALVIEALAVWPDRLPHDAALDHVKGTCSQGAEQPRRQRGDEDAQRGTGRDDLVDNELAFDLRADRFPLKRRNCGWREEGGEKEEGRRAVVGGERGQVDGGGRCPSPAAGKRRRRRTSS